MEVMTRVHYADGTGLEPTHYKNTDFTTFVGLNECDIFFISLSYQITIPPIDT